MSAELLLTESEAKTLSKAIKFIEETWDTSDVGEHIRKVFNGIELNVLSDIQYDIKKQLLNRR